MKGSTAQKGRAKSRAATPNQPTDVPVQTATLRTRVSEKKRTKSAKLRRPEREQNAAEADPAEGATIRELRKDDKRRITRLLKTVLKSTKEKERAESQLAKQRTTFEERVAALEQQNASILLECRDLHNRFAESLTLLRAYAEKLREYRSRLEQVEQHHDAKGVNQGNISAISALERKSQDETHHSLSNEDWKKQLHAREIDPRSHVSQAPTSQTKEKETTPESSHTELARDSSAQFDTSRGSVLQHSAPTSQQHLANAARESNSQSIQQQVDKERKHDTHPHTEEVDAAAAHNSGGQPSSDMAAPVQAGQGVGRRAPVRSMQLLPEEVSGNSDDPHSPSTPQGVSHARRRGRRAAVSAEPVHFHAEQGAAISSAPRPATRVVQKSADQIARLTAAVQANILFASLDDEERTAVLNAMEERHVPAGTDIITEGDEGDFFYVVDDGNFDVFVNAVQQGSKAVARITEGGSFGEIALMYNTPRTATVRSCGGSQRDPEIAIVWALDRQTFQNCVVTAQARKRVEYEEFLRGVDALAALSPAELSRVADAVESCTFSDGETILLEGEDDFSAMKLYIVRSGTVEVSRTSETGSQIKLGELAHGTVFGERALVEKCPRTATVTAKGRVTCASLDIAAFERLLGPCVTLLEKQIAGYAAPPQPKSPSPWGHDEEVEQGTGASPLDSSTQASTLCAKEDSGEESDDEYEQQESITASEENDSVQEDEETSEESTLSAASDQASVDTRREKPESSTVHGATATFPSLGEKTFHNNATRDRFAARRADSFSDILRDLDDKSNSDDSINEDDYKMLREGIHSRDLRFSAGLAELVDAIEDSGSDDSDIL